MVSRNLTMRLKRMESGGEGSDAELIFANGSHASLPVRDALSLCLDAMRNESEKLDGLEPTPSKHSAKLNLLARAVECRTEDNVLRMAHDVVRGGTE